MKTLVLLIIICLVVFKSKAQYENIIFEGAGIKGLAYAGVVKGLEERGHIADLKRIGGTSAGAITAVMLSIGYNSEEIYEIISSMKFQRFNQRRFGIVGGINRMNNRYGWYRSEQFEDWIGQIIKEKTGDSEITFEELNKQGYKDLYVVATCLNKQKRVLLSRETYPKMKIKDGVKISISIPLYFEANFIDKHGHLYKKKNEIAGKDIMVDGGIIGNYPIDIFDEIKTNESGDEERVINFKTIGIRIDTDEQIKKDKKREGLEEIDITNFKSFINAFYVLTIESLNRNTLTDEDWARTISVSSVGIGPKIKRLTEQEKNRLMESGVKAVNEFFNKK